MIRKPYIGICDFNDLSEVSRMLMVFLSNGADALDRYLMVGIMMSYKTLHDIKSKWTDVFPKKDKIKNIFSRGNFLLNTLHYADYDGIDVANSLELATGYGGKNMDAIQLDMIWPEPEIVMSYREKHPQTQVILQINSNSFEMVNNDPASLVRRLSQYGDAVDYALLDKSMGRGLGMDAKALLPFAMAITEHLPYISLATAGGLGPNTLHLVEPLVRVFPAISIDAQTKLRPGGSALDPIDWNYGTLYIKRAIKMFGRYQNSENLIKQGGL